MPTTTHSKFPPQHIFEMPTTTHIRNAHHNTYSKCPLEHIRNAHYNTYSKCPLQHIFEMPTTTHIRNAHHNTYSKCPPQHCVRVASLATECYHCMSPSSFLNQGHLHTWLPLAYSVSYLPECGCAPRVVVTSFML